MARYSPSIVSLLLAGGLAGCGGHSSGESHEVIPVHNSHIPILGTNPSLDSGLDATVPFSDASMWALRIGVVVDAKQSVPSAPTTTTYADPISIGLDATANLHFPLKSAALGHQLKVVVYLAGPGDTGWDTFTSVSAPSAAISQHSATSD